MYQINIFYAYIYNKYLVDTIQINIWNLGYIFFS